MFNIGNYGRALQGQELSCYSFCCSWLLPPTAALQIGNFYARTLQDAVNWS